MLFEVEEVLDVKISFYFSASSAVMELPQLWSFGLVLGNFKMGVAVYMSVRIRREEGVVPHPQEFRGPRTIGHLI